MKKLLFSAVLFLCSITARAEPSVLGYGLTVTGGSFTVTLTGTNTARIGTNEISTLTQVVGDSGIVATQTGTRVSLSFQPAGISNSGNYVSTNGAAYLAIRNASSASTNIVSGSVIPGVVQRGYNFLGVVSSSNCIASEHAGYFRYGAFWISSAIASRMQIDASGLDAGSSNLNVVSIESGGDAGEIALQLSDFGSPTGGVRAILNGPGAKILGAMNMSGSGMIAATNSGAGSLLLVNLTDGEAATVSGSEAIGMGAVIVTNDQAIVVGDGRVSHGVGSITAGSFWGSGANLTGIPPSSLTFTPVTNVADTRYESASSNFVTITNSGGVAYPVACLTNGTGTGGGSVTLRTNPVLKASSHPGSWSVSSDVPAGGGGSMAFELPASTSTQYRATFRSSSTATVTRTIQGPLMGLSSVASNWAWIVIDHVASTNFLTNTVSFATIGATSALFSVTCTTTALYYVQGTNAAGNRELIPSVTTSGTGNGTTNYGRAFMPNLFGVEQ